MKGLILISLSIIVIVIFSGCISIFATSLVNKPIEKITAEDLGIKYYDEGHRIEIGKEYYPDVESNTSSEELDDLLHDFHFPADYKMNVFDCSDMSACLEWWLEGHGYHTIFIQGISGGDMHMWLYVWVDEQWKLVEPTSIFFCPDTRTHVHDIPTWREEIGRYENIEEALEDFSVSELDWWAI